MDEDCIESGEPIYELASECEKLFSEQILKLKDEADINGSKVVGEYQQRFSAWAAFLGVFAVPEMCLDRRLQRHVEIQDLVLRLLDIMKRNLTYLFENKNASDGENIEVSDKDGASSPRSEFRISIESLRGIEGAIERLHHLGGTIQLSSEAKQATKFGKFAAKFDSTSFEEVARLAISSFYPDASPSLIDHLASAMNDMCQKFHYRRSRQVRLQARPHLQLSTINEEPASQIKAATWKVDPPPAPAPRDDIYKRLARPIVISHLGTRSHQSKDSKPTSLDSQEFRKLFPQRKDGSVKSKTRSVAASLIAYPQPSEKSPVCDWCFSPLPEDELKGDKWKKHLNEDFKPFVCISEKCSEPLRRFATSRVWFSHMLETHGQNWHREVHLPAWWICPLCNNQDTTYTKSQDLSEHISKLHGDVFTEQQVQIIVHQSRLRAPRPQDVCPLCCLSMKDGQDSDDEVLRKSFPKLSVQGEQPAESYKRIKTETGSVQLDQHKDVNSGVTEQATPNPQIPAFQSQGKLNVETIARHIAAHLQGIMLFSLRMMALDAVAEKSTDDKTLSGGTDDYLSRLGSNRQHSLPETQEMEDTNYSLVQDESMDIDDPLLEDTVPDCEHVVDWQNLIPNSEPTPEADKFLQQVIDSGAFQTKEQSPTRVVIVNEGLGKRPIGRPRTPPATIIIFPFRHDPYFIGHEAVLHNLIIECSKPPARLALVGMGGIGKTQLAIELAYRLVKSAKMSVFWINAESQSSIDEGFKTIALNVSPGRQVNAVEALLRTSSEWLSNERNGRWVMILDGANDHSIFHDELYLPKSQNGTIIITTRRRDVAYRLTGNQQDLIEIGPMSVFEAVTLLEKKLGRTAKKRPQPPPDGSPGATPGSQSQAQKKYSYIDGEWVQLTVKQRLPKNGAASGLVKSLGLIPLAICRAAAYIQSISAQPPIKDNDDIPSHLSVNSDSLIRRYQIEHAKIIPRKPRADLSSDTSHDYDGLVFDWSEEEETVEEKKTEKEETVEEDTSLLHVEGIFVQLRDSEQEKIKLLEFEDFSPDQSGQIPRGLFRTWKSSFDAIRSESPSALSLLSLMSFFDRRGIPKWLLRPSRRSDGIQQANVPHIEGNADDEVDFALNDDIETLMDHCLITSNGTREMFEMHGLVQLSVKKNLDASLLQAFEQQFIKRLATAFPKSTYSNWAICEELFAHVQVAATCQPNESVVVYWTDLLHEGSRFARLQGRYGIAMQLADRALKLRKTVGREDLKILDNMSLIALIFMDRGLYDKAEELFTQVADECKRVGSGVNSSKSEVSMNNLASIYKAKGRWAEAAEIQTKVEMTRARHLGQDHLRTLTSKANMASIFRAQGQHMYAELSQRELVDGYRNKLGPDHPLTLTSMNNLGSICRIQGRLLDAESLQVQAMESLKIKLGAEHPDTLASMNCLASTYRAQGRLNKAEALQEQTLEIRTAKLGSDHPNTLASMNNLALIYSAQGKHQKAAKIQSEVVEICKAKLGSEHPHTLTSLNNIALIWKGQGRDLEGKVTMDNCVEKRRRVLGQHHPYTISSEAAADKWWAPS